MMLEDDDFPITAEGIALFAEGRRIALATCRDAELAADIARRLNFTLSASAMAKIEMRNAGAQDGIRRE